MINTELSSGEHTAVITTTGTGRVIMHGFVTETGNTSGETENTGDALAYKKVTGKFVGQPAFENVDEVRVPGTIYSPYDAEVVQFNYDGFSCYDNNNRWI